MAFSRTIASQTTLHMWNGVNTIRYLVSGGSLRWDSYLLWMVTCNRIRTCGGIVNCGETNRMFFWGSAERRLCSTWRSNPLMFQGWWHRQASCVLPSPLDHCDSRLDGEQAGFLSSSKSTWSLWLETWRGAGRRACVAPDNGWPGKNILESTSNHYKIIRNNYHLSEFTNICLKLHSIRKVSEVPPSSDRSRLSPSTIAQNDFVHDTSLTPDSLKYKRYINVLLLFVRHVDKTRITRQCKSTGNHENATINTK